MATVEGGFDCKNACIGDDEDVYSTKKISSSVQWIHPLHYAFNINKQKNIRYTF